MKHRKTILLKHTLCTVQHTHALTKLSSLSVLLCLASTCLGVHCLIQRIGWSYGGLWLVDFRQAWKCVQNSWISCLVKNQNDHSFPMHCGHSTLTVRSNFAKQSHLKYRRSPRYTVPLIRGFGDTRFSKFDNSLSKLYWFDTSILNCQIISVLIE